MDLIQIRATVDQQDVSVCRFAVDRPVNSGSESFSGKEEAAGNGLAEKLFNVPGITKVDISGNIVTLTKDSPEGWNVIGKRIGGAIRSFLQPPPDIPEADMLPPQVVRERVQRLLNEQINPGVASHGGFVEL